MDATTMGVLRAIENTWMRCELILACIYIGRCTLMRVFIYIFKLRCHDNKVESNIKPFVALIVKYLKYWVPILNISFRRLEEFTT